MALDSQALEKAKTDKAKFMTPLDAGKAALAEAEKNLAALVASKSSCVQVVSDQDSSAKATAEELKVLADENAGAQIGNGWSRGTDVRTVPGKCKCCCVDNDRSG